MNCLAWGVALLCLCSLKTTILEVLANSHPHCDCSSRSCDNLINSGSKSLTKDVFFFLIFLTQAIVLLVFFWQRRQFITRTLTPNPSSTQNSPHKETSPSVTEHNDITDEMSRRRMIPSPVNRLDVELDQQMRPIERAVDELNAKIKGVERTLIERKGQYPTESLKLRLRECISQITNVLSELEEIGKPHSPINDDAKEIRKWEEQRKELEKKRKALEERLAMNKAEQEKLENSSKSPRVSTPQSASGVKATLVSASVSTPTSTTTAKVSNEPVIKSTLSLPTSSPAATTPRDPQRTSPRPPSPSATAAPVESSSEDVAPSWLKNVNPKQMGRVLQKGEASRVTKKRGAEALVNLFVPSDVVEQHDQRQPKKQKSISRADAKKIGLEQFRDNGEGDGEGAEEIDDLKQSLADLDTFGTESSKSAGEQSDDKDDAAVDPSSALDSVKGVEFNSADLLKALDDLNQTELIKKPSGEEDSLTATLKDISYEGEASADPHSESDSESGSESTQKLVSEWAVKADINKAGMRRARKPSLSSHTSSSRKSRFEMEDIWCVEFPFDGDEDRGLFCVFDGHAGKKCAEAAARLFPTELANALKTKSEVVTDLTDIWKPIYLKVDEQLKEYEYEGTTASTVFLWKVGHQRYVQAANVGDSTAFIIRNGEAVMLTEDHRPTIKRERDRITEMGIKLESGQTRLNGLAVSRALGDHFPKEAKCGLIADPYVSDTIKIEPTDTHIIIASDGLWDVLTGQHAYEIIESLSSAEEMASTLLNTALKSSKCTDNVTVIVIRL